jgi:hypothetical protein
MKLNFKVPLLAADGKPTSSNLNTLLANLLLQSTVKPPLSSRFFLWALELEKSGEIEVNGPDIEEITKFINEHNDLTVLGRGRLMEVMYPLNNASVTNGLPACDPGFIRNAAGQCVKDDGNDTHPTPPTP